MLGSFVILKTHDSIGSDCSRLDVVCRALGQKGQVTIFVMLKHLLEGILSVEKERLDLKFCRDIVDYTACVPTLPSSLEDIYPTHNMFTKDAWVENLVNRVVQERKRHEMNQTMKELGENEYGQKFDADGELTERGGDRVERRFWNG